MNYQKIHDIIINRAKNRLYDSKIHHKHHVIPLHEDPNSTETVPLTFKEHKIIHLLRWKITGTTGNKLAYLRFKNILDEFHRMKSSEGGKIGGQTTKEKKLGIFSPDYNRSKETKKRWEKGIITTKKLKITPEKAKERGMLSFKSQKGIHSPEYDRFKANEKMWKNFSIEKKNKILKKLHESSLENYKENEKFLYWCSPEGLKKRSSLGGKSHIGKKWLTKNGKNIRIPEDQIDSYMKDGWELGLNLRGNKK